MLDPFKLSLVGKPAAASFIAQVLSLFIKKISAGISVDLYGCGSIGQALTTSEIENLKHLSVRFIQTDPKEIKVFNGYSVIAPQYAVENPADITVLLSDLFDEPMRACLKGSSSKIYGLKEIINNQNIEHVVANHMVSCREKIASIKEDIVSSLHGKPLIAFVTDCPLLHTFKVMENIRKQGFFVLLCVERTNITSQIDIEQYEGKGCFDALFVSEKLFTLEVVELLNGLNPYLVHAETGMWNPHSLGIIIQKLISPVVVDYRDIQEMIYKNDEQARHFLKITPEEYALDIKSRHSIFTRSAAVIYKEGKGGFECLEGQHSHDCEYSLQYLPYIGREYVRSKDHGGNGIVYAGNFSRDPESRVYPMFQSMLDAVKIITAQGIHFTIYNSVDSSGVNFEDVMELDRCNEFFHYKFALPYNEMCEVLKTYDYGWMCFDFSITHESVVHNDCAMPSKIFSYLESGLGILYSPELKFVDEVTNDMGVGIPCPFDELHNLGTVLSRVGRNEIWDNILNNQHKWTHEFNIHKLVALYCAVGRKFCEQ